MSTLRGVNLGGWLVLEPWMTPSLFKATDAPDEFTYCQNADASARKRLREFRDTFITEADFAWLAEHDIQAVRLPIGYWMYGDTAPYVGTKKYVDLAFVWAERYGIKILLDLHGAPGSQNGEMHSGQVGVAKWNLSEQNIPQTLNILRRLAEDYGQHTSLLGISLLNEPSMRIPKVILQGFYEQAYIWLKPLCHDDAWIVCSDGFRPNRWRRTFRAREYPGLHFDYHQYQIFSWLDRLLPASWQLWRARHTLSRKLRRMSKHHPIIVGEWSRALRWEKVQGLSPALRAELYAQYDVLQRSAFAGVAAWFYWNYKVEGGGAWSFRDIVD